MTGQFGMGHEAAKHLLLVEGVDADVSFQSPFRKASAEPIIDRSTKLSMIVGEARNKGTMVGAWTSIARCRRTRSGVTPPDR
jgi:hypothetical protein